jgi:uncharacterized protein YndB with AHSA1/START domain
MTAESRELRLDLKRTLPAAPSFVFRACSAADELAMWWGPEGFTAPSLDFKPRVGGSYTGEFREVDPPSRLVYTFVYEDPDPDDVETLAELSFRDLGEFTEVVLTQGPFNTEARRDLHRNGWTGSFDRLERLLSRR